MLGYQALSRRAGLWCYHIAPALGDCVLMLAFSHLAVPGTGKPQGMEAELWAGKWSAGDRAQLTTVDLSQGH